MTTARRKFSQEFRDELCREVISTSKPIRDVAEAYGIGTETELTVPERARLKELV
jgi:transposase